MTQKLTKIGNSLSTIQKSQHKASHLMMEVIKIDLDPPTAEQKYNFFVPFHYNKTRTLFSLLFKFETHQTNQNPTDCIHPSCPKSKSRIATRLKMSVPRRNRTRREQPLRRRRSRRITRTTTAATNNNFLLQRV
jgi:hypothetical protein